METLYSKPTFSFLQGGGEMGEITRNHDWENTSLGHPDQWPQSLKSTLSIILNSKFPMFLWWGEELIQFYNDAYRPSLGEKGKHPKALGQKGEECWPEIWSIIYPLIEQVMTKGEATWSENQLIPIYRNGRLEDVYWTFSYTPVNDESGKVGGVLVVCNETTDQIQTLLQLKVSDKRFQNLVREAPVGIVVLYGEEMRVDIVNDAYGRLIDRNVHEMLGKPLFEIIPDAKEQYNALLQKVRLTGETIYLYGTPYLVYKDGKKIEGFLNLIYQPYREEDGTITGVMALCHDVTEQVIARKKMEESEHRFRSLIENTPVPTCLLTGSNLVIEVANEAMIDVWGKGPSVMGKPLGQALPELKGQPFLQILNDVFTSGKTYEAKATPAILLANGVPKTFYFDFSYTPVFNSDGEVFGIIDTAIDVTDKVLAQRKVEESEQNLRNIILHAPVAMCILRGADHVVEIANERMSELWGKEADGLLGKPLFVGLPEVKAQGFEQLLDSVYNTGEAFKAYEVPVTLPRANGIQTVLVDFVYEAYREANNNISGIMVVAIEVTEKVQARKKIEESEQQIRSIIESAPFPIGVYTGKEMRIQFANEAILNAWGKGTDVIGKLYADVLPELSNQEIFEQLDSVFTTGLAFNAKHQQVDLVVNGKLQHYYFNYSFTPLFDPTGKVYGVMNTAADVTDLNLAKIKIEQSERNFRNLVMKAPLAIGLTRGKDMVFESINEPMLGLIDKKNDVIGKPLLEVLPELLKQPINNILGSVYENGESFRGYEIPISLKIDGKFEERYYNISYTPLPQKELDLAILHIAVDVTEQVINRKKIEASEARFRLMADAMPQFVWTSDVNGNLNYFNQAVYNYSGLSEEQIQKEGWLQIVHPDDRAENIELWMHSIKALKDFVFHHRFKNKEGEYRWQLSRAIPQYDKDGAIQLWVGTSTDIHEQKLFEEELNKQVKQRTVELESKNLELELINKELEQFTYAASHDMQEPLRKVQTFSSFLLENNEVQLDDRGKNYLKKIGTSVQRMKTIITDLLHYSHQTREEQQFVTTDLNKIIDDVEADMEVAIQKKEATIVKDKLPGINAVQSQMNQLFSNLFSNALKFSKPGIPLEIKITSEIIGANSTSIIKPNPAQSYLKINFTDNGIGFDQQYAEQIFSLFKRLHGKTEYEGTGIGLGLCKKIVQNHNGAIWANSELGKGANFTILLPLN